MYLSFGYLLLLLFFSCFHIYPRNILFTIINSLEVRLAILSSTFKHFSRNLCLLVWVHRNWPFALLVSLYVCVSSLLPSLRNAKMLSAGRFMPEARGGAASLSYLYATASTVAHYLLLLLSFLFLSRLSLMNAHCCIRCWHLAGMALLFTSKCIKYSL